MIGSPVLIIHYIRIEATLLEVLVDNLHELNRFRTPERLNKGVKVDLGLVEVFCATTEVESSSKEFWPET